MWRIVAVLVVALAFGGALAYGGQAMGAWDEYKPVPDKAGTRIGGPGASSRFAKAQTKGGKSARRSKAARSGGQTWAGRASAICRRARPDLELLARELAAARTLEEFEAALSQLARANRRVNARLEAIPPPPRQHARVRALHALLATDDRIVTRMLVAVRRRDAYALRTLVEAAEPVMRRENEIFWVLGANECTVAAYLGEADALA